MSAPPDPSSDGHRRLDAFIKRLRADVYPEPESPLHAEITTRMVASVLDLHPMAPGAAVLDVGCGQGQALELFAAAGLVPTGITLGEDVAACRAKGLDVREMDLAFLDFEDARFDLVWCRHALEHSIFPYFTLSEIHRVLKPGGVLYLEVPAPDTACRHEANLNHYSVLGKGMWLELIRRAGFVGSRASEMKLQTGAGPDVYWAFIQTRPA